MRGGTWTRSFRALGEEALAAGEVAVVTLSGGAGSRWTHGAGVVKALSPFCRLAGKHRTFLEVHLAKSRRTGKRYGCDVPHAITTSYLTHGPIEEFLRMRTHTDTRRRCIYRRAERGAAPDSDGARPAVCVGRYAAADAGCAGAEGARERARGAGGWAQQAGEAASYTDNLPLQCLHPVGHWYEVPNLFLSGVLRKCWRHRPRLRTLMVHNVDTLGADLDPGDSGPPHREQGNHDGGSCDAAHRRPRRRAGVGRRARALGRGHGAAFGRDRVCAFLLQLEYVLDRHRCAAAGFRIDEERFGRTARRWPRRFAPWPRECRPTSH